MGRWVSDREYWEDGDDSDNKLRGALQKIADLTPETIDVLPLDQAFRKLRDATKIAREALKK